MKRVAILPTAVNVGAVDRGFFKLWKMTMIFLTQNESVSVLLQ